MPKRIISEFREVPIGMLFQSEEDDCVYIKFGEDTAVCLSDEFGNYPVNDDAPDFDDLPLFEAEDEVQFPLPPDVQSDTMFNARQRAEDMKQELRLLHMVLGDEEWQRIFASERTEPAEVSPEVATEWPFAPRRVPNSE